MINHGTHPIGIHAPVWVLNGQLNGDQAVRAFRIENTPFIVGRNSQASLTIPSPTVSNFHAELEPEETCLHVRDMGSTNGTFVNGVRIEGDFIVKSGDLVQFANVVFRVALEKGLRESRTIMGDSTDRALALIQFDKLMADRAVSPHYQPIVDGDSLEVVGYEVLGRSRLFGLSTPAAMFSAAAVLDMEAELSRMLRSEGLAHSAKLPGTPLMFVNTHPTELAETGVLEFSLRELHDKWPNVRLVLEIHEAAITSAATMRELRAVLRDLDIGLAYDDFGAGQARLVELAEVPPDFLKFDIALIRDLGQASQERQRVVASLTRVVADLGIVSLAEGVETESEHMACRQAGFRLCQGFLFGKPAPAAAFHAEASVAAVGRLSASL